MQKRFKLTDYDHYIEYDHLGGMYLVVEKIENKPWNNKKVVFTGQLDNYTRSDATELAEDVLGATIQSKVTSSTDIIVVGNNWGSKLTAASRIGVKMVTEKQFTKLLAKY